MAGNSVVLVCSLSIKIYRLYLLIVILQVVLLKLAGHHYCKQRNEDFIRINTGLQIFNKSNFYEEYQKTIIDHFDLAFSMGDFNNRINHDYEYINGSRILY
jgi:hypothetical protein